MGDIRIQYKGFTPTELQRSVLNMMVSSIADEAPESAVLRAKVVREGSEFHGLLHIDARFFHVSSAATASSPSVLVSKLREEARRRLSRLKTLSRRSIRSTVNRAAYDHAG